MKQKLRTRHLPVEEIDRLRIDAFKTNSDKERHEYFDAASLYFQERHERAINRSYDLESQLTSAKIKMLNDVIEHFWFYGNMRSDSEDMKALHEMKNKLEKQLFE